MKSILEKISIFLAKRKFKKEGERTTVRKLAREAKVQRVSIWHRAHDSFFILLSIFLAGFGLKGFFAPQ